VVIVGLFYVVSWAVCFAFGLWLDEDVNHWEWPTDHGPGVRVTAKIAGASAVVAVLPLGVLFAVGWLAKYLGSL
jgi:hypothetical protein